MREDKEIREYSYRVERTCWLLIFFSMLTQGKKTTKIQFETIIDHFHSYIHQFPLI